MNETAHAPLAPETLANFLKVHTREIHRSLEGSSFMSDFLNPDLDLPAYQRHLLSLSRTLVPLEAALDRATHWHLFPSVKRRVHMEALQSDLLFFSLTGVHQLGQGADMDLSRLPNFLGALYVVEGSALGGSVIAKSLARRLGLGPQNGLAYFSAQATSSRQRWQDFKSEMQDVLPQSDFATCLESAIETFRRFS